MTVTPELEKKVDAGQGTPEENQAVQDYRMKIALARQRSAIRERQADEQPPEPQAPEDILANAGIVIEDAADFLKRKIQPPRWIVQDFIAEHMKGDLCGGAKSMKTFSALQMAVCIAAGRDFLNVYHVAEKHTVAYLNLELFDWTAQERLKAQISAGLEIDEEELRGRLYILNMRNDPAALRGERDLGACAKCRHKDNCHGIVEKLCRAEHANRIVETFCDLLKQRGVELVIIDPRYKLIQPGEDENTGDGLRGVLDLRNKLAQHFAVMIVTHDPKGDSAERKTTDRGAGSYTAGADFDFRLTIDRSRDYDEEADQLLYVVGAACRARKTPPKVGVRFDPESQVFRAEDGLTTETFKPKGRNGKSEADMLPEKVAERNAEKERAFMDAAVEVATEAGSELLDTATFQQRLLKKPGGAVATSTRSANFTALWKVATGEHGVLKSQRAQERKANGTIGNTKERREYVSTPDRIAAYLKQFEGPGI